MYPLTLTSIQAQNADLVVAQISDFLGEALGCDSEFLAELPWTRRLARLDEVDLAWMCGLPYVRRVDSGDRSLEPLVAAVMAGRRYQGRPIYYSDIVVNASSPYDAFEISGVRPGPTTSRIPSPDTTSSAITSPSSGNERDSSARWSRPAPMRLPSA